MSYTVSESVPDKYGCEDWNVVRPLTRTRKDDGALYVREADVDAEIRYLCGLSDRERRDRLTRRMPAGDPGRLREETLVYFLREYDRRGGGDTAWRIAETLIERTAGHIARKIARWRLTPDDEDDCARDLYAALCEALFRCEPASEFWEVRFWVCLDRRLWNLIEKRQAIRDGELAPGDARDEGEQGPLAEDGTAFGRIADEAPGPERLLEYKEALGLLTENERLAVYLCHVEGLPEESDDPERVSAARLIGVTGRSVRNYLRRAEAKLRTWQAGAALPASAVGK
jgi:DNA-directed RNA polymerase specialized sigma24 family protein